MAPYLVHVLVRRFDDDAQDLEHPPDRLLGVGPQGSSEDSYTPGEIGARIGNGQRERFFDVRLSVPQTVNIARFQWRAREDSNL